MCTHIMHQSRSQEENYAMHIVIVLLAIIERKLVQFAFCIMKIGRTHCVCYIGTFKTNTYIICRFNTILYGLPTCKYTIKSMKTNAYYINGLYIPTVQIYPFEFITEAGRSQMIFEVLYLLKIDRALDYYKMIKKNCKFYLVGIFLQIQVWKIVKFKT